MEDDELEELIDATSETAVLLKMEDISDDGEEEIDISQFGPPRPYVNQQVLLELKYLFYTSIMFWIFRLLSSP